MTQYSYQLKVSTLMHNQRQGILALDTGCGKTKIALEAVCAYNEATVVCPAFLRTNWEAEAERWNIKTKLNVISYDSPKLPIQPQTKAIIFDECHYIRNHTTRRAKNSLKLVQASKPSFLWFLSATPVIRSAENLYPILKMLNPAAVPNLSTYRENHCLKKPNRFTYEGWEWHGMKPHFLDWVRSTTNLITLEKSEVLQLPQMLRERVSVKVSPKHLLSTLKLTPEEVTQKLLDGGGTGDHIAIVRRELGEDKVLPCAEAIKEFEEGQEGAFVVWAHHTNVIEQLSKLLDVPLIIGSTAMSKRRELVDGVQSGSIKGLVCSVGAAGTGLTLTAAKRMYWVEKPFLYSDQKQAEDRLHRIGQDKHVRIVEFFAPKTLDVPIERALEQRKKLQEDLYGTDKTREV